MDYSRQNPRPASGVKLTTLQRIENLAGSIVCACLSVPALFLPDGDIADKATVKRVLVVKFWGIGSLVLAEPFFERLRETYPDAEIHLLTLWDNRQIVPMLKQIDEAHYVNLGGNLVTAILAFVGCLGRTLAGKWDVLIDMEFYTRASSVVAFCSRAPLRIGYHSRGVFRGRIHNHRIPFNVYWHVSQNFIGLLAPFGVDVPKAPPRPVLDLPEDSGREAEDVLNSLDISGDRFLVVNVNAGELAYERRWFPERFAELTARLYDAYRLPALFIGSASERDYVQRVCDAAEAQGARTVNLAGQTGLAVVAELCRRAALTITNDSGPLHVACAAGARVAGFFGPETPVLYGPLGEGNLAIYEGIACSPCINVERGKQLVCWHHLPFCQEGITVDKALQAITVGFGPVLETATGETRRRAR